MTFETVNRKLDKIIDKYWHEEDEYYSRYRYDNEEKEFDMIEEVKEFFEIYNIPYEISQEDGFDSPGYSNDFFAVAFQFPISNSRKTRLKLKTVMFECM